MRRLFTISSCRIAALLALMILAPAHAPAHAAKAGPSKETTVIQLAAKRMDCAGTPGFVTTDPVYLATCVPLTGARDQGIGIRLERYASAEHAAAALSVLGNGFDGETFRGHPARSWYQTTAAGVRGFHAWQADRWLITSAALEDDLPTATKSMLSFSETLHAIAAEQGLFK